MIPGTFVFEGVVREYVLRAPIGWQEALNATLANDPNRLGLPLLVAFHGGRVGFDPSLVGDLDDPEQFQRDWRFPRVWEPDAGQDRRWEDQCFVLYPYALGAFDLPRASPLEVMAPRRWGAWNPGWSPNDTPVGDDRFVNALIEHLSATLLTRYRPERRGAPELTTVFDPDRRFLFGRGNGGMMALRMVATSPQDTWAAAFVLSAAIGGSPDLLGLQPQPLIFNDPDDGVTTTARGVSLFAVHGELDTHVPPGRHGDPVHPELASDLSPPGLNPATFTPQYSPMSDLIHAYRRYAGIGREATLTSPPGQGRRWTSRRSNGVEVVEHRDPLKGHFDDYPRFDARFVWDWFREHPRPGA